MEPEAADETPLDVAYRAQEAAPEDDTLRLRFHERVLDAELFLLLAEEAGERLKPRVFDLEEGRFVLAFDRDDRLAAFLVAPAPYAALAGRRVVAMLAGRGIGIGLNLGAAPSATLLPAGAVDWMAAMLGAGPVEVATRARRLAAPRSVPQALLDALGPKLGAMVGLIEAALLAEAALEGGETGLILALVAVPEPARSEVAAAIAEAVRFSGLEAGLLDVSFLDAEDPLRAAFERVGLRFEMPRPAPPVAPRRRRAPGGDPDRPPILR